MSGLFITFEGPEGGGKSTHAARLAERLRQRGRDVVAAREPGGTLTGEAIRGILQHDSAGEPLASETELLLFEASRAQLVQQVIKPALARDAIVICDRFSDSTTAYQGYGREFDVERVLDLNAWASDGVVPDLTLLLDLDVGVGADRVRKRNETLRLHDDRFEREARVFHERVRQGYLDLATRWPARFRVISAAQSLDAVASAVDAEVESLLQSKPHRERGDEG